MFNESEYSGNLFHTIIERTSALMAESVMPTSRCLGYQSKTGIYGGQLVDGPNGTLLLKMTGPISTIDRYGDWVFRTADEHVIADPVAILKRHPRQFMHTLGNGPLRHRANTAGTAHNAKVLGLDHIYQEQPNGIAITQPEVFTHGVPLQDILHADEIGDPRLQAIDRLAAIGQARTLCSYSS